MFQCIYWSHKPLISLSQKIRPWAVDTENSGVVAVEYGKI